jgi:hypothetical protein
MSFFLLHVPMMWKLISQQGVSLLSSEAEYYAIAEAEKEVKFVVHLIQAIGIKIKMTIMTITTKLDNIGAIFMTENMNTNSHAPAPSIQRREWLVRAFILFVSILKKVVSRFLS